MQLIGMIPDIVAVFDPARKLLYDDFSKTGQAHPSYIRNLALTRLADGIQYPANGHFYFKGMPTPNLEMDTLCRRTAIGGSGTIRPLCWRADGNFGGACKYECYLMLDATNVHVNKRINGVITQIANVAHGVNIDAWFRMGIRHIGKRLEVFFNGKRVVNLVDNSANANSEYGYFGGQADTSTVEWQVFVVRSLGQGNPDATGTITGTVRDSLNALTAATITTTPASTSAASIEGVGTYTLQNVPGGTYTVNAVTDNMEIGSVAGVVVMPGQTTANVNIVTEGIGGP